MFGENASEPHSLHSPSSLKISHFTMLAVRKAQLQLLAAQSELFQKVRLTHELLFRKKPNWTLSQGYRL